MSSKNFHKRASRFQRGWWIVSCISKMKRRWQRNWTTFEVLRVLFIHESKKNLDLPSKVTAQPLMKIAGGQSQTSAAYPGRFHQKGRARKKDTLILESTGGRKMVWDLTEMLPTNQPSKVPICKPKKEAPFLRKYRPNASYLAGRGVQPRLKIL